jgi:hypothetical protein
VAPLERADRIDGQVRSVGELLLVRARGTRRGGVSAQAVPDRIPVLLGAAQTLHETTNHRTYGYYVPDDSLREH